MVHLALLVWCFRCCDRRLARLAHPRARPLGGGVRIVAWYRGRHLGGPSGRVFANLVFEGIVIVVAVGAHRIGVGSILGWALRTAVDNLSFIGALFVRALPVVLLTVLVFFNTYVWSMASIISRPGCGWRCCSSA